MPEGLELVRWLLGERFARDVCDGDELANVSHRVDTLREALLVVVAELERVEREGGG